MRPAILSREFLIAIVDDDAAMRDALFDLLQVAGFSGQTYAGAAAFLDNYAPGRFSLLITDLRMPGMDGIDLLRTLRAMGAALPAIVVTSCDPATRARVLEEGALACLAKPVEDDALLRLIGVVLARDGKGQPGG
jgi:FixJ family two-component response regulator